MRSPGINGEGELRGNWLTQVHLEKWPLKRSVCEYLDRKWTQVTALHCTAITYAPTRQEVQLPQTDHTLASV